jgi:formylglycine-generating enzyme required for sulfatase activity
MVVVQGGHFTMTRKRASDGRKDDDPEALPKSRPAREVEISHPFAIGVYPVTRQEFGIFAQETRRTVEKGCHVQKEGVWVFDQRKDWRHPGFAQTARDPVTCVNWNDAQEYVRWLNGKLHAAAQENDSAGTYRLPTWEEIEYAAGGGIKTAYYWGAQAQRDKANYGSEKCLPCRPEKQGADRWLYTSPVGSFPPNPFGLYDLAGNVWQWAEKCRADPNATPPIKCQAEILHGGSWLTNPEYLRTGEYTYADIRHRNNQTGFRVARTLNWRAALQPVPPVKSQLLFPATLSLIHWSVQALGAASSASGVKFRDCPRDCPEMTVIPAGSFVMGTDRRDVEPDGREGPPHTVTFGRPFALGIYDVTRGEYAAFVRSTGKATIKGCNVLDPMGRWITDPDKDWRNPGFHQTGRDPVVCVDWEDAQAYIAWLNCKVRPNGSAQGPYRLPSEAEWEYAARAGSTTSYYWGDVPSHDLANYGIEHCFPCGAAKEGRDRWYFTSPVGSFPPNAFGLYDALGNVWQWTADCMHYGFTGAPSDGLAWTTDANDACHNRVLRGGSWLDSSPVLVVFVRNPWAPTDRNYANGFRVARILD